MIDSRTMAVLPLFLMERFPDDGAIKCTINPLTVAIANPLEKMPQELTKILNQHFYKITT